jgi:hypothetical protein
MKVLEEMKVLGEMNTPVRRKGENDAKGGKAISSSTLHAPLSLVLLPFSPTVIHLRERKERGREREMR